MENIVWHGILDKFFDAETMSIHLKENNPIVKKKWFPGNRKPVVDDNIFSKTDLTWLIDDIYKELDSRDDWFLEIDRKLSKVLQLGPYRIVIVYPPLSDGLEMTIVKPVKKLSMEDYGLWQDVYDLLKNDAKWILVAWAPWSGKTTFAQALIEVYNKENAIIKTIESPRDLLLSDNIVQYSFTYASHDEVRDILLLSRPDYTVYDEVRNKSDFELYKDLRLTWIGLVGVIHATRPVDSIQRFLWTIEMWIIPQVIDTVVYIDKWLVQEVLQLSLTVKVPEWMFSEELARPVVVITSFLSKQVQYEIYTFGEQIVVMPILEWIENKKSTPKAMISEYAKQSIDQKLSSILPCDFVCKVKWSNLELFIPEYYKWRIIGKWWAAISDLEKSIWLWIKVKTFDELPIMDVKTDISIVWKNNLEVSFPDDYANKEIWLLVWNEILIRWTTNQASIFIVKDKALAKMIDKKWFVLVDLNNL